VSGADAGTARGGAAIRRAATWSVPLLLVAGAGSAWLYGGRYVATDNAYLRADVVAVAARVDGTVAEVHVAPDARVRAGDLLVRLDDTEARLALSRAEAELAAERSEIASLRALLDVRRAERAAAAARRDYQLREARRLEGLVEKGVVSRISYDAALEQVRDAADRHAVAGRAVAELEARLEGAVSGPSEDHPRVRLKRSAVDAARVLLGYCELRAPQDGQAGRIEVFPGEQVEAGRTLFALVGNDRPWLEANLKETQIAHLRPGQPARVAVDAYPGAEWTARVESVGPATGAEFALLPPENASGNWVKIVQRVPVRLALAPDGPDLPLRAGMSATVRIDTGEEHRRYRRWFAATP
jgi:membrane fusion protein (multidrug efflux system)